MKIVFRVDASTQIGTGHVMRCLTLADALSEAGAGCYFIYREHEGHLGALIEQRGHQALALPLQACKPDETPADSLAHAAWLGASQQEDARECALLLQTLQPDWLIVDHYALDRVWESQLRPYCRQLMVIDDLADRQHDCDLLLDQTYGRDTQDYIDWVPSHCELLCGSMYALLRPEFTHWREYSLARRKDARLQNILINLGGVDKGNVTGQVLDALHSCSLPSDCAITVVMGATAPWINEVKKHAKTMPWPTQVKVGVSNMAELMANSDLAIGAAGSTSWERCCLGLPTLMLVLAENQEMIANRLSSQGACTFLKVDNLNTSIHHLLSNFVPESLTRMTLECLHVTDGGGAKRIIQHLGLSI
ncbi:UDP-2,4-diacetamido-2,4,6-trideoxy-beta-L-altropyranose hydrolase [Nitrincola tibetensis]|uniref:UDP-2,4-diacetamido-2,4, 6-trideoxy-beta-L-altropyranose hydrolase n=1 Tax=Nitrincola tibetensis TaxID=2219697 RepID=A0A364NI76_9GAMM|nr:UDP-2,4-diacetamido-2,4,6-trideoxy-beta-L-altropyranose hydrolase [Nitrincola tibetensis]RAU16829.1 UDP-2,4-diacetamido-2,4,6-trideoxy-beta-L-altropyranose hydrolase [Nitrincola tibetensis]